MQVYPTFIKHKNKTKQIRIAKEKKQLQGNKPEMVK
jgi:hypothetical protein